MEHSVYRRNVLSSWRNQNYLPFEKRQLLALCNFKNGLFQLNCEKSLIIRNTKTLIDSVRRKECFRGLGNNYYLKFSLEGLFIILMGITCHCLILNKKWSQLIIRLETKCATNYCSEL